MIWGSGYVIAKYATEHGVPPLGYSFWQSFGPALLLVAMHQIKKPLVSLLAHKRFYLICGFLGIAVPNSVMYFAAPHLPSGLLAVIVNTVPIMTYVLALLIKQEAFSIKRCLGVIIGMIGILLLMLPNVSLPEQDMLPWALCCLITPLSFASCALYIHRFQPADKSSLELSAGMLLSSAFMLFPVIFITNSLYVFNFPFNSADWIVILEIILSSIGYILFFLLIRMAGPVYYSLVGGVVCMTGLWWGYILYHETLTLINILAIFLILTAILLTSPTINLKEMTRHVRFYRQISRSI